MTNLISVGIVDDHDIVRDGLRHVFSIEHGFRVVGEASTCVEARKLVQTVQPDILLVDQMLPDGSGIDLCLELNPQTPRTTLVLLTAFPVPDSKLAALNDGGIGAILYKDQSSTEIRRIVASLVNQQTPQPNRVVTLSGRERQILELIAQGWQNKEISVEIGISEKTVRNLISAMFRKLGVSNRTEAARYIPK